MKKTLTLNESKVFFIAEIGVNHNGSIAMAKKLIDQSVRAGCSAVKFQVYKTSNLVKKKTKLAAYQIKTNENNMFDLLKKYEFSFDQFKILKKYCDKKKIIFLATPFDYESLNFLKTLNLSAYKISSGDLDNFYLLKEVKKTKKPIILSTGMSDEKEIKNTLNFLKLKKNNLFLLHCISEYPVEIKNTQLGFINNLKKYGYHIGLSDHTKDETACIAAVSLGCLIIEKHITLNRKLKGPDHSASLECKKLKKLISNINDLKYSISHKKRFVTPVEQNNKKLTRKLLYFLNNKQKGDLIDHNDIIPLRSNKKNGIKPSNINIVNKKLKKNVTRYNLIKLEHF